MKTKRKNFNLKNLLDRFFMPIVLIGVWLAVCIANYTPNTYLTGWDNLHPEFDFWMNLKRLLGGAWAEYQGLGAPGAHSHAADLPRMIIVGILSVIFDKNFVRYAFVFLTLIVGVLGVYYLVSNVLLKHYDDKFRKFPAFLAALFYMLNVGTVQHFIAPFEMFNVQFAMLPWLFALSIKFLESGKKKHLFFFGIATFFSTAMAYASTLWFAYFIALLSFLFFNFISNRNRRLFVRSSFIVVVTLLINSFWLIPTVYYAVNYSRYVPTAKTNIIFSEEAFLTNQKYGDISDVVLNKGFLFDWTIRTNVGIFEPILGDWNDHISSPLTLILAYLILAVIIVGIIYCIKRKKHYVLSFLSVMLVGLIFLMGTNPPFGVIFESILSRISVLQEALRFPFTKFSIIFIFAQAVFFGYGCLVVSKFVFNRTKIHPGELISVVIVLFLAYLYAMPTFNGNFINKSLRINIPQDYFQTFDFFKQQDPNSRIADFPVNNMFGWFYTDWYYQGSGLLWYGIEQPILDRDFDRWYSYNEDYYDEISKAVFTLDSVALEEVLQKYSVDWIVMDEHILSNRDGSSVSLEQNTASSDMAYKESKELFSKIPNLKLEATYGKINIYKYTNPIVEKKDFIEVLKNDLTQKDTQTFSRNIFDEANYVRKDGLSSYNYDEESKEITYTNSIGTINDFQHKINLPEIYDQETAVPVNVLAKIDGSMISIKLDYITPEIFAGTKKIFDEKKESIINFTVDHFSSGYYIAINDRDFLNLQNISNEYKLIGYSSIYTQKDNKLKLFDQDNAFSTDISSALTIGKITNCSNSSINQSSKVLFANQVVVMHSFGQNICVTTGLSKPQNQIYLNRVTFQYKSPTGISPDFCIRSGSNCINKKSFANSNQPGNLYNTESFASEDKPLGNIFFDLILNNNVPSQDGEISYQDIILDSYPLIDSESLSTEEVKVDLKLDHNIVTVDPVDNTLDVSFKISDNYNKYALNYNDLKAIIGLKAKNCKDFEATDKVSREEDSVNGQIIFNSEDGFNCENINFYNMNLDNGFLIKIKASHVEGTGMVINSSDFYFKKQYYADRLPIDENFDYFFTIPNLVNNPNNGINIFLNSQSVGGRKTINGISSISVQPIVYKWLHSITLVNSSVSLAKQTDFKVEKYGTYGYVVTLPDNTNSDDYIVKLNQSYEPNWRAYDQNGNKLTRYGDVRDSNNQKYLNWNNSWVTNKDSKVIYIQYSIEYGQFFGYALCVLTLALLGIISIFEISRKKLQEG